MKKDGIPLEEFLQRPEWTQAKFARALGIVQSAVSQMLVDGREIYVRVLPRGRIECYEVRSVPASKRASGGPSANLSHE